MATITEEMTALLERRRGHDTIPIPRGKDDTPALPPRKSKVPANKRKGFVAGKRGGRGRAKTDTVVVKPG